MQRPVPPGILFLCVANSARSQMAEGIARSLAPPDIHIFSAGSNPGRIHTLARSALAEIGIESAGQVSKGLKAIEPALIGLVVTLCADEICPAWLDRGEQLHWGLADPAAIGGDNALDEFRLVRDQLVTRIEALFASFE